MKLLIVLSTLVLISSLIAGPIEDLKPGEWYEIPNSRMDAVGWPVKDYPDMLRTNGHTVAGVMSAWSGGAFDTKRNRLVVWGGGHNSYAGNELYAFDVDDLKWYRLNDPNTNPRRCSDINTDGTPVARHTYNQVAYIMHGDRFFGLDGACDCSAGGGCPNASTWLFDFEALSWSKDDGSPRGSRYGSNCCYDPLTHRVYFHNASGGMASYNLKTGAWIAHNFAGNAYYRTSDVDVKRKIMVEVGHSKTTMTYDLTASNLQGRGLITTGPKDMEQSSNVGFAYDPVSEKFIGWINGSSVFSFDPDTRVWEKHTAANSVDPGNRNQNGTYGRFRYVPSKNLFIVANEVSRNVFVYKHTAPATAPQWYMDLIDENSSVGTGASLATSAVNILVTPHPFSRTTVIRINCHAAAYGLTIFDTKGSLIKAFKENATGKFVWHAGSLPNGTYLARIQAGHRALTKPIFLIR